MISKLQQDYDGIVFNVIKEYINDNRTFEIDKALPFIYSRLTKASLNITNAGLLQIIKRLIEQKLIVEGSKLSKDDILTNLKRKAIYEYILEHPGAYFTRIVNELGFTNKVVAWHLNFLKKFEYIQSENLDNREVYFQANLSFENVKLNYFLSKSESKKIIAYLNGNNTGISKTQISEDLSMHLQTTSKYLEILEGLNIISKEKIDNNTLYFLKE